VKELEEKIRSHDEKAYCLALLSSFLCPIIPVLGYGAGFGLATLCGAEESTANGVGWGSLAAFEIASLSLIKYHSTKHAYYDDALHMKRTNKI